MISAIAGTAGTMELGPANRRGARAPYRDYPAGVRDEAIRLFRDEKWSVLKIRAHLRASRGAIYGWIATAGASKIDEAPRPPKGHAYPPEIRDEAIRLFRDENWPVSRIRAHLGVSYNGIYGWLSKAGLVKSKGCKKVESSYAAAPPSPSREQLLDRYFAAVSHGDRNAREILSMAVTASAAVAADLGEDVDEDLDGDDS